MDPRRAPEARGQGGRGGGARKQHRRGRLRPPHRRGDQRLRLKPRVLKALGQNLAPDEQVKVVIVGASGQVIVGTQTRAFVIKPGFLAGATFGAEITSWSYTHIAGVQVHKGMMTGSVVIQGPGQTGQAGGYWRQGDSDPHKAQNAIPIARGWDTVNAGVARLRHLIAEAHAPSLAPASSAGEGTIRIADELAKLRRCATPACCRTTSSNSPKGRLLGRRPRVRHHAPPADRAGVAGCRVDRPPHQEALRWPRNC
jgi:hypothetical protein